MQRKDILIYDTDETNELMENGMNEFCSLVFNLKEISDIIVDTSIYTKNDNPSIEKTIFFGDDDYNNLFLEQINNDSKYDIDLLMGHYFFLGNEKVFKKHFNNVIDEEEYIETINNSKYLLTASVQSALESIACGNSPVIFKREDKQYNMELIEKLNIPCIENSTLSETINEFETIIKDYPTINNYEVAEYQFDMYVVFWERATKLLKSEGLIGFITPITWLNNQKTQKLRRIREFTRFTNLKKFK